VDVKMTEGGRTVYGGGGITPDEKFETREIGSLAGGPVPQRAVQLHAVVLRDAPGQSAQGWMPDESLLVDLKTYLKATARCSRTPISTSITTGFRALSHQGDVHYSVQPG